MAEVFPDLPTNEQTALEPEAYFTKDIVNMAQNVQLPETYIDYHLTEEEAAVEVLENVGNIFELPQPDVEALPTAKEQLGAAFELENPISNIVDYFSDPGSTTSRRGGEFYDENNNFDVKRWLTPEEAHLSRFMEDAETPDEAQAIYDKIQEEQVAKGILGSGPLNPFAASLPAVLADPSIFIPVVGGATKLGTIGRIAITGAGQALLTEAIIQQNQLTRTMTDSAINVVASGLFSGGAGAAAIGIRARVLKKAEAARRAEEEAAFLKQEQDSKTVFDELDNVDEEVAQANWDSTVATDYNGPRWNDVKDNIPEDLKRAFSTSDINEIKLILKESDGSVDNILEAIPQKMRELRRSEQVRRINENFDETRENIARVARGEEPVPTRAELAEEDLLNELNETANNEYSSILRGLDPLEENTHPVERAFNNIIDDDYYNASFKSPDDLGLGIEQRIYNRDYNIKAGLESEELTLLGNVDSVRGRALAKEIREKGVFALQNRDLSPVDQAILRNALEIPEPQLEPGIIARPALRPDEINADKLKGWAEDVERLDESLQALEDGLEVNLSTLPSRTQAIAEASRIINDSNRITFGRGADGAYAGIDADFKGGMMLPDGSIHIGKDSKDFHKTLMHEVGHNLIFNRLLRSDEVNYLREAAHKNGWMETFKVNNRWSDIYKNRPDKQAQLEEEAIVEAFANWAVDPRPITDERIIGIFNKLKTYLKQFVNSLKQGVLGNANQGKVPKDFRIDEESERIFSEVYAGGRQPEGYPEGKLTIEDIVEDVIDDDVRFERTFPTELDLDYEHYIKYRPAEEAQPAPREEGIVGVERQEQPEIPEYKPSLDPNDTRLWRGRLGISEHVNKGYALAKGAVGFSSSSQRASISPFPTVREFNFRLNNVENQPLAGHAKGKAMGNNDIETRILQESNRFQANHILHKKKSYGTYRERVKGLGEKPLDKNKFTYEVGRVFRTGQPSTIPEVNQVADNAKSIIEHWQKEATKAGLEIKANFIPTSWNRRAIDENTNGFLDILQKNIPGLENRADAAKALQRTLRENNGTRVSEPYKLKTDEGEFDLNIEALDNFFEDDIDQIIDTYLRTIVPDVELKKMFGTTNPNNLIEKYVLEDLQTALKSNPDQSGKLVRRARQDIRNLQNQVDEMRGLNALGPNSEYAGLARIERGLRQYSFSNLLGGVTVSSLPELTRLVTTAGFQRAFGTYIGTYAKGLKTLSAAKDEAVKQGAVIDMINAHHTRINLGDDNLTPGNTKVERALEWNAKKMGVFTGLTHYTDGTKIAASAEINDFILRTSMRVEKGEKLADLVSQRDLIRLARIGIDEEQLLKIAKEKKNFQNNDGLLLAGIETWEDAEAAATMRNAVVKETLSTIITPRPSNRPAWANKAVLGRSLYFLKSFLMASDSHIVQANLAYADSRTLTGATMALGLGMAVQALKDIANYGEVKDRSTREWIVNGIDRSGLIGSLLLWDTVQSGVSGHSLQAIASGGRKSNRYQERGFESALGPIVGGIPKNIMNLGSSLWDGYATKNDFTRLKRALPWQNHPLFSYPMNQVIDSMAEKYNLPRNYREALREEGAEE